MGGCKAEHHWGQVAWLNYSASRAAPGRRGGATAIPGRLPFAFPDRKKSEVLREGTQDLEFRGDRAPFRLFDYQVVAKW